MKDVVVRNMERLILLADGGDTDLLEPMSVWKWRQLYQTAQKFGLGAWVAAGLQATGDDFFVQQIPAELRDLLLTMEGDKDPQHLAKFYLQQDRKAGMLHHLKPVSLKAYAHDLLDNIRNIEE